MTPLLAQAQQLETALHGALHATKDNAELAIYADALLNLQRCIESLEKLPNEPYRIVGIGEVLKWGDEYYCADSASWYLTTNVGFVNRGHQVYRRPTTPRATPEVTSKVALKVTAQDIQDILNFLAKSRGPQTPTTEQ